MAAEERKRSIFSQESLDRVTSPEKLDDYIRIARPGIWIMIVALFLVVVAVVIWGVTGSLPQTVTINGVVDGSNSNMVMCLVDASAYNREDLLEKEAQIQIEGSTSTAGTVTQVSDNPVSAEEMREALGSDWFAAKLIANDYSYLVQIEPEEDLSAHTNKVCSVSIVTDQVSPISFLFD